MVDLSRELTAFLEAVASRGGIEVESLLRQTFHLRSVVDEPTLRSLLSGTPDEVVAIWDYLNDHVRVLSPGFHYAPRATFVGYRREVGPPADGTHAARSQVFLSVRPVHGLLTVTLPVSPATAPQGLTSEDLSGKGHHGVGNLRLSLASQTDVDLLVKHYRRWLISKP